MCMYIRTARAYAQGQSTTRGIVTLRPTATSTSISTSTLRSAILTTAYLWDNSTSPKCSIVNYKQLDHAEAIGNNR